jgi:ATP-dependent Lon protease
LIDNIKDLAIKIIELDPNIPELQILPLEILKTRRFTEFYLYQRKFLFRKKQKLLEEKSLMNRAKNAMN